MIDSIPVSPELFELARQLPGNPHDTLAQALAIGLQRLLRHNHLLTDRERSEAMSGRRLVSLRSRASGYPRTAWRESAGATQSREEFMKAPEEIRKLIKAALQEEHQVMHTKKLELDIP